MKEHTELLSRNVFTQFPAYHSKNRGKFSLADIYKKYGPLLREQCINILAATGIGAIFLVSIALFLIQLAEFSGQ